MLVHLTILALGLSIMPSWSLVAQARAAELKLLSVNGVKLVLPELVAAFEAGSGNRVSGRRIIGTGQRQ